MKNVIIIIGSAILFNLLFLGCSRPANFLYIHTPPKNFSMTQKVREVTGNSALDMFWAIGGMTEQQSNFQAGVTTFMNQFTQKKFSYRMAMSSSNVSERPYLGMPTIFDDSTPNPTGVFVSAVNAALRGIDDEQIFDPVYSNLSAYPMFIRSNATLIVILTNDAPDSSSTITTADDMLQFLANLKGGDLKKVIVYGIFGATDLNCQRFQIDTDWNYHGSPFETVIQKTGGLAYSLCDATFGASLAKIGDDIYQRLDHPRIVLNRLPDPTTIRVLFHGTELPGGDPATGGVWYYELASNSVVFYNLNFAVKDTEEVTVTFAEDNGKT